VEYTDAREMQISETNIGLSMIIFKENVTGCARRAVRG
jgi:hypothetical protein